MNTVDNRKDAYLEALDKAFKVRANDFTYEQHGNTALIIKEMRYSEYVISLVREFVEAAELTADDPKYYSILEVVQESRRLRHKYDDVEDTFFDRDDYYSMRERIPLSKQLKASVDAYNKNLEHTSKVEAICGTIIIVTILGTILTYLT